MRDAEPVRVTPATSAELRVDQSSGKPRIYGYAAVFNAPSEDLGGFREILRPGAFAAALAGADVRALVNHEPYPILGRSTAGTLSLVEDSRGLRITIDPPDTTFVADLLQSMRRGDMSQMSFRFYMAEDGSGQNWRSEPGGVIREITSIRAIDDVSLVTYPAYPQTEVGVRTLQHARASGWLRDDLARPTPARGRKLFAMRSRLRLAEASRN